MAKFEKLLDDEEIDVPTLKTTVSTVKTNESEFEIQIRIEKKDDSLGKNSWIRNYFA